MAGNRSAFALQFKITEQGREPYEVTSGIVDIVRFEKSMNKGFGLGGVKDARMTDMLWVSWAAARRQGLTEHRKFDDWHPTLVDWEPIDDTPETQEELTGGTGDSDPTDQETDTESW